MKNTFYQKVFRFAVVRLTLVFLCIFTATAQHNQKGCSIIRDSLDKALKSDSDRNIRKYTGNWN